MGVKNKEKADYIYDNYKQTRLDIFYDKDVTKYPKHARKALPILIEKAKSGVPIGYHELGEMLGIPYFRRRAQYIGNFVCACISTSFYKWEQHNEKKLPRLVNIVMSKSFFKKGNYVYDGLEKALGKKPTWQDYKCQLLAPIHAYEHWYEMLNIIECANDK